MGERDVNSFKAIQRRCREMQRYGEQNWCEKQKRDGTQDQSQGKHESRSGECGAGSQKEKEKEK